MPASVKIRTSQSKYVISMVKYQILIFKFQISNNQILLAIWFLESSREIFGEKIKQNDEQDQKNDHNKIPLLPASEQRGLIVVGVHFLFSNEIAMKPSTSPMISPTFIRRTKMPMARPNTMAATPAIFLLVISACCSLFTQML